MCREESGNGEREICDRSALGYGESWNLDVVRGTRTPMEQLEPRATYSLWICGSVGKNT